MYESLAIRKSVGLATVLEGARHRRPRSAVGPEDLPMNPEASETFDLRSALEASGRRLTKQRAAVFDLLRRADHHPTAEDVYLRVKETVPSISLATVYKALEALVASGLASKLVGANGSARYDGRGDRHYHLRCLRSGTVQDLPTPFDPDLIGKIDPGLATTLRGEGFHVTGYRLELLGYFEDVQAARPVEAEGDDCP